MKNKKIIIGIIGLIILILGVGIFILFKEKIFKQTGFLKNNESIDKILEEKIIVDIFTDDTAVEKQIENNVLVVVEEVDKDNFSIEIESPNIADELFEWVSEQDEISDEELEEQIIKLLNEEPKEKKKYVLYYEESEDEPVIHYTNDSLDSMSCGMLEFYNMAMEQVIEDMKAGE